MVDMNFNQMPGDKKRGGMFGKGPLTALALIGMLPNIERPSAQAAFTRDPIMTSDASSKGTIAGPIPSVGVQQQSLEERSGLILSLQEIVGRITEQKMQCSMLEKQSQDGPEVRLAALDAPSFDELRLTYMRAVSFLSSPQDVHISDSELRALLSKLQEFSNLIALDIEKCRKIDE